MVSNITEMINTYMKINEVLTDYDRENIPRSHGFTIVDEVEIGDYTLSLFNMGHKAYQLGLSITGENISDPANQFKKIPLLTPPSFTSMKQILSQISTWISKYGSIRIESYNIKKIETYHKIITRFGPKYNVSAKNRGNKLVVSKMDVNEVLTDYDRENIPRSYGFTIVDEVEIGDYTLSLFNVGYKAYQLGFSITGENISDPANHFKKIPLLTPPSFTSMRQILSQLSTWISKYGPVFAGSENPVKQEKYYKILKKFGSKYNISTRIVRLSGRNVLLVSKN